LSDVFTIVVADDHPVFRRGLAEVVAEDQAFRIVAEAGEGESALAFVRHYRPHIVVLDINMPKMSGLEVAAAINQENLKTAVVLLTMYREAAVFRHALDMGVRGYVLKDSAVNEIAACLHMVAAGRAYISPALSSELLERRTDSLAPLSGLCALTAAEQPVLQMIARGLTTAEIATALGKSVKTIENHRAHICQKMGVTGPQALLRFALEHKAQLQ
jgi:DNA-binding NarL/FixJ family response regulator